MSPLQMKILLHCYTTPHPYNGVENQQMIAEDLLNFSKIGLVELNSDGNYYHTTPKGEFYIKAVLNTPYPESTFYIPNEGER